MAKKEIVFDRNIKKEIKEFIRNKNLRVLEVDYRGKRLNSAVLWSKIRNPLRMVITGFFFEYFKRLPPCELKNILYRLFGIRIGKDVVIAPYIYIDPLFPELITIEDGVLVGGTSAIISHEFFEKKIRIGKTVIKNGVQLGARSFVRAGMRIGKNSQVGVYSFVNKDVEDYEFVAGNPAKHIKWIYPYGLKFGSIGELLDKRTEENKDKIFLIDAIINKNTSYTNFNKKVNNIANYLKNLNIKKEDVVAILLPNSDYYLLVYFAIQKIGAIAHPVNTKLKEDGLEFLLKDSGTSYIFTNNDFIKTVEKVKYRIANLQDVINIDDKKFGNEINKKSDKFEIMNISTDDASTLIYTSGTTGRSKGVLLSHKNLIANLDAFAERLNVGEGSVHLAMRPLFYVAGIFATVLLPLFYGGTIVLCERFSRRRFWKFVDNYKVNYAELSTSMIPILLNPPEDISKYDISPLRFIGVGGAPLSKEIVNRFEKHFKVNLFELYGLTESSCLATCTPPDVKKRKIGSPGTVLKTNRIKVVDEDGNEVKSNGVGEILIKGPNIINKYYEKKEKKEKIFEKGWFRTGDLGYLDEEGYIFIVGRKKELIRRGQESISPNEIDDVLYKHPKIKEACTIGVFDEILGEEIKAYVALKEGKKVTEKEIIDFCKKYLAEYKCPKSIEFLKELPEGPTGKIVRKKLQEMGKNVRRK